MPVVHLDDLDIVVRAEDPGDLLDQRHRERDDDTHVRRIDDGGALRRLRQRRLVLGAETRRRSEEHTSELQSRMRSSYAVFCLKKKKNMTTNVYRQTKQY